MRIRILVLVVLAYLTPVFATLEGQEPVKEGHIPDSATLKVRIIYRGALPNLPPIDSASDPVCANLLIPNETLTVGNNGALQNVALIWDERRNAKLKVLDKDKKWRDKEIEIVFDDCQIKPRIAIVRAGQKLKCVLKQATAYSPHFSFFNNPPLSLLIPAGQNKVFSLTASEPAPIPVECNVHPWMRAHLIVKEHPYVGVSNVEGAIEIDNLPVGENVFQLWHEAATTLESVVLNGVEQALEKRRIRFKLEPGLNDLGVIELQDRQFKIVGPKK